MDLDVSGQDWYPLHELVPETYNLHIDMTMDNNHSHHHGPLSGGKLTPSGTSSSFQEGGAYDESSTAAYVHSGYWNNNEPMSAPSSYDISSKDVAMNGSGKRFSQTPTHASRAMPVLPQRTYVSSVPRMNQVAHIAHIAPATAIHSLQPPMNGTQQPPPRLQIDTSDYPDSHPTSPHSGNSMAASSISPTSSSYGKVLSSVSPRRNASTPTSLGGGRRRRPKNKQQHNAEEHRRRTRLRDRFSQLRIVSECDKKDRYNILTTAIEKLTSVNSQIKSLQAEREILKERALNAGGNQEEKEYLFRDAEDLDNFVRAVPSTLRDVTASKMLTVPSVVIGIDGRFLQCNENFCKLTGMNNSEVCQSSLFSITQPDNLKQMCVLINEMLYRKTVQLWECETNWKTESGSGNLSVRMMLTRTEGPVGCVLVAHIVPTNQIDESLLEENMSDETMAAIIHCTNPPQ